MTAVPLVLFAAIVATIAPHLLGRSRWWYRAPQLGIVAWYCVLTAVTSAVAGSAMSLVVPWWRDPPVCIAWRWCLDAARGHHGALGQIAAAILLTTTTFLTFRLVVCAVRLLRAQTAIRREHLQLLALTGRRSPAGDVTIVDSDQPAAYMLAGPHRRIVVTTGAIDALTDDELAAVVAHERAHATGHHDVLLNGVRLLALAFPTVHLFRAAAEQLHRLVELRADEVAVADHPPLSLARALVTLAGTTAHAPTPTGAVGAAGGDASVRLGRLLSPPDQLTAAAQACIRVALILLAATPALTLASLWLIAVLELC